MTYLAGRREVLKSLVGWAACSMVAGDVFGQSGWPSKPIRLVLPYAAGGPADLMARMIAEDLSKALAVPVLVENRPGGGGTVGAGYVVRQPADGYTLVYMAPGTQITSAFIVKDLSYDPKTDFVPISRIFEAYTTVIVPYDHPARSLADLLRMAKEKPDTIALGTPGVGSSSHLTSGLLQLTTGARFLHVPFGGTGQVVQALLSGTVQVGFDAPSSFLPLIEDKKLRLLAVWSPERLKAFPDVPSAAETLHGVSFSVPNYLSARAGTPPEIVDRVSLEMRKLLAHPRYARFEQEGLMVGGSTSDELQSLITREMAKAERIIKETKILPN